MAQQPLSLMVQGTTSDAGKSVLVAALCRILARAGFSVAPFKSQNMALNSAVVPGGEIGRAQFVQAEAANIKASVLMNPVLLKPSSDTGAQVIVLGKAQSQQSAKVYHQQKPALLKQVVEAFTELQQQYPWVIVEGAGSPAEVNLRDRDIANMGFAEAADIPVVIVADIDRGGVLAHLYGTLAVLSEAEQKRVKGFVINRFRGDVSLLQPGLDWLEEKTGKPVLAVIPYIENLHIEAEDRVAIAQTTNKNALNIVIPVYPRASNHTDFDALRLHPDANVQLVKHARDVGLCDLIILPGSKAVLDDIAWLKAQGFEHLIKRHLRYGGKVLGICGGYQMLGETLNDPKHVESSQSEAQGLGLLPMSTTFFADKTLRHVTGTSTFGAKVRAYEMHQGQSTGKALNNAWLSLKDEAGNVYEEGAQSSDGQVLGTYLHGLFDEPSMLNALLQWAGKTTAQQFDYAAFKEQEFNRLADVVEAAWPIEDIIQLLEQKA